MGGGPSYRVKTKENKYRSGKFVEPVIQIIAQSSISYKKLKVLGNLSSCMYSYFTGFAQEGRLGRYFSWDLSVITRKRRVNWYFYIYFYTMYLLNYY